MCNFETKSKILRQNSKNYMETTTLELAGNFWIFLIISILLVVFSIYSYYHTNPPVSQLRKSILISLRSLALILLLLIIFQPSLLKTSSIVLEPSVAVLIDNSISNGMQDASVNRKEIVQRILNDIKENEINKNSQYYRFANSIEKLPELRLDSINFNGQTTNLSKALYKIRNDGINTNTQAIILISDGAINDGPNPLYNSENQEIPIFSIGIGDTISPKDIAIKSIISNEITFVNTPIEIVAQFTSTGFKNQKIILNLFDNESFVSADTLTVIEEQRNYTAKFMYKPEKEGEHKISVQINPLRDEFTDKNNENHTFIKVLSNKKVISICAASATPDLSLINQYLSEDKDAQINLFVQKSNSEYYVTPTHNLINETQLFVLIGFPGKTTPDNVVSLVAEEMAKGKPILFIAGNSLDYRKLNRLLPYLPFDVISSSNREFEVWVKPVDKIPENPLLRIEGIQNFEEIWENLAPVNKTETFVSPKVESTVLATSKIENINMNEPLILIREVNGLRSAAVIAFNLYKWKLTGYAKEIVKGNTDQVDLFSAFFNNTLRWLSVSNIDNQFVVKTNKKHYFSGEQIEFKANVWDKSITPISNAQIKVKITSGKFEKEIDLPGIGNGIYFSALPSLQSGNYKYSALAIVNKDTIAKEQGLFSVGLDNFEYINLTQNKKLLSALSLNSNGMYLTPEQISTLPNEISKLENFKPVLKTSRHNVEYWNHWVLLTFVILLFSIEWFLRKKMSML